MALPEVPLDESVWSDPSFQQQFGPLNSNTVFLYFTRSIFFDPQSNNNVILLNAHRTGDQHLIDNRVAQEDAVRRMTSGGIQYIVTGEPNSADGAWVIEKQQRTVNPGDEDKIEIIGTYFIIGDLIFMAPSTADIIGNRILSVTTSLNSFFNLASNLAFFTPATGHTYMPPNLKSPSKAPALPGAPSREISPTIEAGPESSQNTQAGAVQAEASLSSRSAVTDAKFSNYFFAKSLTQAMTYANEFTDENPVQGEPGGFRMTYTNQRVAAQNAARAQELLKAQSNPSGNQSAMPNMGAGRESTVSTAMPTPKPVAEVAASASRKGSMANVKRRKSMKPTSPT